MIDMRGEHETESYLELVYRVCAWCIRLAHLPEFGKQHFDLPFNATGKKWVRFAVWDSAGNGAFVQPVPLK